MSADEWIWCCCFVVVDVSPMTSRFFLVLPCSNIDVVYCIDCLLCKESVGCIVSKKGNGFANHATQLVNGGSSGVSLRSSNSVRHGTK